MMFQALYTDEPVSVNGNNPKRKEEYQKNILELFSSRYPDELSSGCPIKNKKCYFLMIYFYKGRKQRDIDNILKYTIDALRKKIYNDDKLIEFCLSESISCDKDFASIDMTSMDTGIAGQLYDFISEEYDREHTSVTYIECGLMNDNFYNIGLEELWK